MSRKVKSSIAGGVTVIVLVFVSIAFASRQFKDTQTAVATTLVKKGDVEITVITPGEFRAPHSAMLVAPQVNGTLQIISMLQTGAKVKPGDVIVEFDPSEQEYNYEQAD